VSQTASQQVELTGWRNGLLNELLLVVPTDGTWDEVMARVRGKLEEVRNSKPAQGALVTIDFGGRSIGTGDLVELVDLLKYTYGLLPVAVVATATSTREAARAQVLNAYLMLPGRSEDTGREATSGNNALYLPQTVRSGQRIVHAGNLVIGGDVNQGAEVIAEGNIVVFGTLRGVAHAGSAGDERASITAGNMRPQLVRIAGQMARSPEDEPVPAGQRHPEVARIENGIIQVSPA